MRRGGRKDRKTKEGTVRRKSTRKEKASQEESGHGGEIKSGSEMGGVVHNNNELIHKAKQHVCDCGSVALI